MPNWAGSWTHLLWFFLGSLSLSHLCFYLIRPSEGAHRCFTYLAVALGGLSLVPTTFQSNAQIATIQRNALAPRLATDRELIVDQIGWAQRFVCGNPFVRTADSPPNFDQIEEDRRAACQMMSLIANTEDSWLAPTGQARFPAIPPRISSQPDLSDTVTYVERAIREYNSDALEMRRLEASTQTTWIEISLAVNGPYIAALAFSLALATVAFPASPHRKRKAPSQSRDKAKPTR
jgi:hypothetical protein